MEQSENIRRSLLGGALSMEFDTCSTAAAEINNEVYNLIEAAQPHTKQLYYPDDPLNSITASVYDLHRELEADYPFKLVLVRPHTIQVKEVQQTTGLFRKRSATSPVEQKTLGSPRLAALVGQDIVVPLATFERKVTPDECSYVQIGDELSDESFFSTLLDEGTNRLKIVEAMRVAVGSYDTRRYSLDQTELDEATRQHLAHLFNKLVGKHREQWPAAFEAQLVREYAALLHSPTGRTEMYVLDADGNAARAKLAYGHILNAATLSDGRRVGITVGGDATDPNAHGHIYATTRNALAFPLATVNTERGEFEFTDMQLTSEDRSTFLQALAEILHELRGESLIRHTAHLPKAIETDCVASNSMINAVGQYCVKLLMGPAYDSQPDYVRDNRYYGSNKYSDEVASFLDRYFAYSGLIEVDEGTIEHHSYHNSDALPVTKKLLEERNQERRAVLDRLRIGDSLEMILGGTTPEEEALLRAVQDYAAHSSAYSGVLHDEKIGEVRAAIQVTARFKQHGTVISLEFSGKQAARTGEQERPLVKYEFDLLGPILGPDSADECREIYRSLSSLLPQQQT